MVLGNDQDYCNSLEEKQHCIKLSSILSADTKHSSEERQDLIEFFTSELEEVVMEFMPASMMPIAYIPCSVGKENHMFCCFLSFNVTLCEKEFAA